MFYQDKLAVVGLEDLLLRVARVGAPSVDGPLVTRDGAEGNVPAAVAAAVVANLLLLAGAGGAVDGALGRAAVGDEDLQRW